MEHADNHHNQSQQLKLLEQVRSAIHAKADSYCTDQSYERNSPKSLKKIETDANPYMEEYSRYFWERHHNKESNYLPEYTSRQMRPTLVIRSLTVGQLHKGLPLKCLSRMTGNCHVRFLEGNRAATPVTYSML